MESVCSNSVRDMIEIWRSRLQVVEKETLDAREW